jgi:hypothetical protein
MYERLDNYLWQEVPRLVWVLIATEYPLNQGSPLKYYCHLDH